MADTHKPKHKQETNIAVISLVVKGNKPDRVCSCMLGKTLVVQLGKFIH